mmetsp:Transcript_8620/g.13212  ORF Transcript_8620/g.13212 Transcript_8620/m.13212 type:complete len:439 (-) Transcript_8620:60-1376(-)
MGNLLGAPVTEKETHVGHTPDGIEYGVSSMQGWRVHMEDAHICEPHVYALDEKKCKIELPGHSIFAVFDGHGGTFAAEYAALNLCRVLSEEPKFVKYAEFVTEREAKEASLSTAAERAAYVKSGLDMVEEALRDAFVNVDAEILKVVQGMDVPNANVPYHPPVETTSKSSLDGENSNPANTNNAPVPNDDEDAGTTAVMVLVTPQWVICANAGDSRAVFAKGGHKAVPLSYDHKPDDEEEERRIRAAGGYVAGGRVEGDLAVSRGLGDFRFKDLPSAVLGTAAGTTAAGGNPTQPNSMNDHAANGSSNTKIVTPEDQKVSPVPDIIVQNRNKELDEFIIVACDGIWDVQTNYEGVTTVANIFEEGERDMGLICEELLDLCLRMGSKDNMTSLVLKFDSQQFGEGGGVTVRRQLREQAEQTENAESTEKATVVDTGTES